MINIFFGPAKKFKEEISEISESSTSLTNVIYKFDNKESFNCENLVVESSEFFSVANHIIENFNGFLNYLNSKESINEV